MQKIIIKQIIRNHLVHPISSLSDSDMSLNKKIKKRHSDNSNDSLMILLTILTILIIPMKI